MTNTDPGKIKIALALGGGGALGWAHIGALRVLQREQLLPDIVTGTSIGALVGAAYVTDNVDVLEEIARSMDWRRAMSLVDVQLGHNGILNGQSIVRELERHFGHREISELPLPYAAIATDLTSGERRVFTEGDLVAAVRASISLPSIFVPVRDGDRLLVDGGLVDSVPVQAARELGAEVVIAIDLFGEFKPRATAFGIRDALLEPDQRQGWRAKLWRALPQWLQEMPGIRNLRDWAQQPSLAAIALASAALVMRQITLCNQRSHPADLIIAPDLNRYTLADFHRADELIRLGAAATEAALPSIKALYQDRRD